MDMNSNDRLSDLARAIAAQVKAERAAANLTQKDLGKAAGLSDSTVLRIENAQRSADVVDLERIARAVGIDLVELIQRAERRLPPPDAPRRLKEA